MKYSLCMLLLFVSTLLPAGAQSFVKVNRNRTVTVSARFPKADEVRLRGSLAVEIKRSNLIKRLNLVPRMLQKEDKVSLEEQNGQWTFTSKALPSDLYTYVLSVDDADTLDAANPNKVREVNTWYNWLIIPGGRGDDYLTRDNVAHGRVETVWYPSSIAGLPRRRMMVYLPPNYDGTRRYPVLYLLHGAGGDEKSWLELGRAAQIMDNLIADKRCKEMIVVMPNGNADRAATPGEDPYNKDIEAASAVPSMFGRIETAFIPDIVNYIDSHYATLADKAHRAIAGLSMGGMHTLFIAANNPDTFDYVGLFSAKIVNEFMKENRLRRIKRAGNQANTIGDLIPSITRKGPGKQVLQLKQYADSGYVAIYDSLDAKLQRQFAAKPKLYYIAIGDTDFLLDENEAFLAKLDEKHYAYTYNPTDGGHEWMNWRRYLVDFLPRLFPDNP